MTGTVGTVARVIHIQQKPSRMGTYLEHLRRRRLANRGGTNQSDSTILTTKTK